MSVHALEGTLERIAMPYMTWMTLTPLVLDLRRLAREDADSDEPDDVFEEKGEHIMPGRARPMPDPIPAKCRKCGYNYVGKDALVSPNLSSCRCFWCHSELLPHRGERDFRVKDKHEETPQGRVWRRHKRILRLCGVVTATDTESTNSA